MREAYLDNSATTRCFPEVVELMSKIYLEEYGNPSSMHHKGVEAEKYITEAKRTLAQILKVNEKNLVFTSWARNRTISRSSAERWPTSERAAT